MGKPLSMDLRSRALAAVDEGMSCRAAATRFGVVAATVIERLPSHKKLAKEARTRVKAAKSEAKKMVAKPCGRGKK